MPLQARALDALERLPADGDSLLLFPGERGGYLDLHNFRTREWKPAQLAVGISPLRRVYEYADLRVMPTLVRKSAQFGVIAVSGSA